MEFTKKFLLLPLLCLLLLAAARGQEPTNSCPAGFESWSTFCYLFVNTSKITWDNARAECMANGAHLLRIESTQEYDFIKKTQQLHISSAYWTDLNARPSHQTDPNVRTFMWGDDELTDDAIVKNHWDREPDNTDFEDCVTLSIQGTISIGDCNERHPYVCQLTKQSPDEVCPSGWLNGPNVCFFVANATDWSVAVTWDEARKNCESMVPVQNRSVQMMAIITTDIQLFLMQSLPAINNVRQVYWIGLNDKSTEGTFQWAGNDGIPFNPNIIEWRIEPNNLAGNEYCGALIPGGMWSDRECTDTLNYICRKTLPGVNEQWNLGCGSWSRAGQKCVYIYNNPQKTWQDARAFCQSQGGDLLRYDNADDANWMGMQVMTDTGMVFNGYWLGLNDIQTEGTFVWTDGTQPSGDLLNWDHEPNEVGLNINQDCAVMGIDKTFLDNDCHNAKAGTICEDPTGLCARNWTLYNGHCYLIDKLSKEHGEGQNFCRDSSSSGRGRLLVLANPDEKAWIIQQLNTETYLTNTPYYFWVDLQDDSVEGSWYWAHSDGENPVSLDQVLIWSREPNDWNHNDDCVQVHFGGQLNDVACEATSGFVCQRAIAGAGSGTGSGTGSGSGSGSGSGATRMQMTEAAWLLIFCVIPAIFSIRI